MTVHRGNYLVQLGCHVTFHIPNQESTTRIPKLFQIESSRLLNTLTQFQGFIHRCNLQRKPPRSEPKLNRTEQWSNQLTNGNYLYTRHMFLSLFIPLVVLPQKTVKVTFYRSANSEYDDLKFVIWRELQMSNFIMKFRIFLRSSYRAA